MKLHEHQLDNGLRVILNEELLFENVLGIIVVRVGSRNDPPHLMGLSHTVEHLMFKGTEEIGTLDFKKEKRYLDEIKRLDWIAKRYNNRNGINDRLKQLYKQASAFVIENEYMTLLDSIGSTHMRAYTGRDATVYQNIFPPTQIKKWLFLNSARFVDPVFRNFNSELETIVNEIEYYKGKPISRVIDHFLKEFLEPSSYANPILGTVETVHKITIQEAENHYSQFYRADNMALILCGNFNASDIMPTIERNFGKLGNGCAPRDDCRDVTPFNGKKVIKKKLLPIRVGIMGYRTVPKGHADEIPLRALKSILLNSCNPGVWSQINCGNKMVPTGVETIHNAKTGGFAIYYMPNLFNSFSTTEKLIAREIEKIKFGEINERFLSGIKANLIKERALSVENIEKRGKLLIDHFVCGKKWEDPGKIGSVLNSLNTHKISQVANRYFADKYLAFYSGRKIRKNAVKKRQKKIIEKKNNRQKRSWFAREFNGICDTSLQEKYIKFGNDCSEGSTDVICLDINPKVHLFHTRNNANDIFSLNLIFGIGFLKEPALVILAKYNNTREQFKTNENDELQYMGSSYSVSCDQDYFTIRINGFEKHLNRTIQLVHNLLCRKTYDKKILKGLYHTRNTEFKFEKTNPASMQKALMEYVLYGQITMFLPGMCRSDVRELTAIKLRERMARALKYEADILYSGTRSARDVISSLEKNFPLDQVCIKSESPLERPKRWTDDDLIFLTHLPGAAVAKVLIIIDGDRNEPRDHCIADLFNDYFGNGSNSLIFRKIREEKGFAYAAGAFYRPSSAANNKGQFVAFADVRNQNAVACVIALNRMIDDMPVKKDMMAHIIKSAKQSVAMRKNVSFRQLPRLVQGWKKKGFRTDPGYSNKRNLETISYQDIDDFYKSNIKHRKKYIMVIGNKNIIDLDMLNKIGKLEIVSGKRLFRK